MSNEQNGATTSAGTIDTPEFESIICKFIDAINDMESSLPYEIARANLSAYIMDWHIAGVAAASHQGYADGDREATELMRGYAEKQAAAAREQAHQEVATLVEQLLAIGTVDQAPALIRALASQPASTTQTDEVTDSVDRDAPLRGAPAVSDELGSVVEADLLALRDDVANLWQSAMAITSPAAMEFARRVVAYLRAAAPVAQGKPVVQDETLRKLAFRTLWLAYVWNDHNFDAAHLEARKTCEEVGIKSFDDANTWLTAPATAPVAVAPVLTDYLEPDTAIRLRRVVNLLGLKDAVPEDDSTLSKCVFSALGLIARAIETKAAPVGLDQLHSATEAWEYSFVHSSATGRGDEEVGPCLTYSEKIAFGVGCFNQRKVFVHAAAELVAATQAQPQQQADEDGERWRFMLRVADDAEGPEAKAMEQFGRDDMEDDRPESEQLVEIVDLARAAIQQDKQGGGA